MRQGHTGRHPRPPRPGFRSGFSLKPRPLVHHAYIDIITAVFNSGMKNLICLSQTLGNWEGSGSSKQLYYKSAIHRQRFDIVCMAEVKKSWEDFKDLDESGDGLLNPQEFQEATQGHRK